MKWDKQPIPFRAERPLIKLAPKKILRPDLSGLRMQLAGDSSVYWIDRGAKRHIEDRKTFSGVFSGWNSITISAELNDIENGSPLPEGAVLAQGFGESAIFLIDEGKKRHIVSPAAMDRNDFAWDKIHHVAPSILGAIPTGAEISWP